MEHHSLSGSSLHSVVHTWDSVDPGAIGAGKMWVDLTDPVNPAFKVRNLTNTGWIDITGGIVGILDTLATHTDVSNAQSAIEANDNANAAAIEGAIASSQAAVEAHSDANHAATVAAIDAHTDAETTLVRGDVAAALADLQTRLERTRRVFDLIWPTTDGTVNNVTNWLKAPDETSTFAELTATSIGAAPTISGDTYNGAQVYRVKTQGAPPSAAGQVWTHARHPDLILSKLPGNFARARQAWRLHHVFAVDSLAGAPASSVDCGLALAPHSMAAKLFNSQLSAGVYFGLNHTGDLVLRARQTDGAALSLDTLLTPVGFDYTKLNGYELRIVSATKDSEAYVQPYLNGAAIGNPVYWGAGTVLPDLIGGGGAANTGWFLSHLLTAQLGLWSTYSAGMRLTAGASVNAVD